MNVREIAKAANVSPATVSLVLNNRPGVKDDTRKKVAELLVENGYTIKTNSDNKSRNTRSTRAASLLFIKFSSGQKLLEARDDFLVRILEGAEEEAADSGYKLGIEKAEISSLENILKNATGNYSGIIVFGTEITEADIDAFQKSPLPTVLIDAVYPGKRISTVNVDNEGGITNSLQYLLSTGHHSIGYLHSTLNCGAIPTRKAAYIKAMDQLNQPVKEEYIFTVPPFLMEAEAELSALFENCRELPDALIADNDVIALSAIRALKTHGYSVTEDISVIGFDDSNLASYFTPALTTTRVHKKALGKSAVRMLENMMVHPEEHICYHLHVETELVIRDTVKARN